MRSGFHSTTPTPTHGWSSTSLLAGCFSMRISRIVFDESTVSSSSRMPVPWLSDRYRIAEWTLPWSIRLVYVRTSCASRSIFPFLVIIISNINICEATARSTKLIEKKSNPTRASFIRKKKRFCLLQPYLVWKFLSHWLRKTSPKVRGTRKGLPKVVSKRSHQEECVQSAKTAKSVASCVASQVLQVADKLPSFPRKAEFSQIER